MFETHTWNYVDGEGQPEALSLLALSTCGFCSKARRYLDQRKLAFRYIEIDLLEPDEKAEIKSEFRKKFGHKPSFPSLIIGGQRILTGFVAKHWDEEVSQETVSP